MAMQKNEDSLTEICAQLMGHQLPLWRELPEFELYMDQVLSLISRYLGGYPGFDEKGLTASMVNNYVKQGVLAPPKKKRYSRDHLAQLLMICLLKTSMPIASVRQLIKDDGTQKDLEGVYSRFCQIFTRVNQEVSDSYTEEGNPSRTEVICKAALRSQAEQALAARLCAAEEETREKIESAIPFAGAESC